MLHNRLDRVCQTGVRVALFLNLLLGHLIGDFLLQPGRLVLAKRRGFGGLALHTAIMGLSCAVVLFADIRDVWPIVLWVVAAHVGIELLTIRTYTGTRTRGLFTFMLDQALHLISIAVIIWLSGSWVADTRVVTFGYELDVVALAWLVALMVVSLFGSILVFETLNAFDTRAEGKGRVLRLDIPRLTGMAERGSALGLAFFHPLLIPLPFVPRLVKSFVDGPEDALRGRVETATSFLLVIGAYVGVVFVRILAG